MGPNDRRRRGPEFDELGEQTRWVPGNVIVRINCLVCGTELPTGQAEAAQQLHLGPDGDRWDTVVKRPQSSYPVNAAVFIRDHAIPGNGPHIILGIPDPRICPGCHDRAQQAWELDQRAMKKNVKVEGLCYVCGKHSNYLEIPGAVKGEVIYLCSKSCAGTHTGNIIGAIGRKRKEDGDLDD